MEVQKIDSVKVNILYEYNDFFRSTLYQYKGCGDIELAPIFLNYHRAFLQIKYYGYLLIPAPSHAMHDEERGFNHIIRIVDGLKLTIINAIEKVIKRKQTDLKREERMKVGEILRWKDNFSIRNKKILIVDDVMTTGSTIKACINLVKQQKPKQIEVLVLAKANKGEEI